MDVIKTRWPEVQTHLPVELLDDVYVRHHLKQDFEGSATLIVYGPNVMRTWNAPHGLEIWLEARDDSARQLLRSLPKDKEVFVSIGTHFSPFGLRVIQEEFVGQVTGLSLFCTVNRERFRPQNSHPVSKLSGADRDALGRYCVSHNAKIFLRFFDEGKVKIYGAYEGKEIVGCCAAFPGNTVSWLEVKPQFRRQGYGRCLLSACVEEMLKENDMVVYEACMDEVANLRVCLAVGFVPLRQTFYFKGRCKDS